MPNLIEQYNTWADDTEKRLFPRYANSEGVFNDALLIPYMHLTHIGGSTVSALMGVNKWKSASDVYDEMTGAKDTSKQEHSFILERGHACEKFIWQQASQLLHEDIHEGNIMVSDDRPWSMCQFDALTADGTPVECKCVSFNYEGEDGKEWGNGSLINDNGEIVQEDDLIPVSYFIQCQKQLDFSQKDVMYLAAWLTFETKIRIFVIHRDEEMIKKIREVEDDFIENNILAGKRPEDIVSEEKSTSFTEGKSEVATQYTIDLVHQYNERNAQLKELQATVDELKKQVEAQLHDDVSALVTAEGKSVVKRSTYTTKRFDSKRFMNELPETYSKYVTESSPIVRLTISKKI